MQSSISLMFENTLRSSTYSRHGHFNLLISLLTKMINECLKWKPWRTLDFIDAAADLKLFIDVTDYGSWDMNDRNVLNNRRYRTIKVFETAKYDLLCRRPSENQYISSNFKFDTFTLYKVMLHLVAHDNKRLGL